MSLRAPSGVGLGVPDAGTQRSSSWLPPQSFGKLVTSVSSLILRSPLEVIVLSPYSNVAGSRVLCPHDRGQEEHVRSRPDSDLSGSMSSVGASSGPVPQHGSPRAPWRTEKSRSATSV